MSFFSSSSAASPFLPISPSPLLSTLASLSADDDDEGGRNGDKHNGDEGSYDYSVSDSLNGHGHSGSALGVMTSAPARTSMPSLPRRDAADAAATRTESRGHREPRSSLGMVAPQLTSRLADDRVESGWRRAEDGQASHEYYDYYYYDDELDDGGECVKSSEWSGSTEVDETDESRGGELTVPKATSSRVPRSPVIDPRALERKVPLVGEPGELEIGEGDDDPTDMSKENSLEFGRNFPHFRSASSILHDRRADVEHLRPDGGEEEELNFSPETWLLVIVAIGTVLGVMATILLVRHREHCGARWLVPIAGVVFGFVGAIWVILKQRYAGREKTCTHRVAAQLGTPYFEIACSVFGFVWTLAAMVEVDSGPRVCRKASETGRALLAAQSAVMVVLCVLSVTMGVSRILTGSYRALIEAGVRGVRYCCCWMGLIRPWRRRRSAKYAHVVDDDDGVRLVIRTVGDPAGEQPAGTVRFVCVSDTHRQHRELRLPDGDVLVHAGDVLFRDRGTVGVPPYRGANDGREVIQELNTWAGELLDKHAFEWIVVVGGNHDLWLEEQGAGQAQSLLSNVQYLCDSSVALSFGESLVTVYGSPVSVGGRSLNRAFQHEAESEELKRVWDHIPDDIDVVVTHSMPSILRPSSSMADVALSKRLASVRPALAVSGHVHLAHGVAEAHGTVFVGAASCNNYYMPVNLPIVVDVELPGSVQLEPV